MDIPRSGNPFAVITALSATLMPLSHAKANDLAFVIGVCLSLIAIVVTTLLKYGFYMRKTPLARIDETSLTFFGNAQAQRRSFQRNAISSIRWSRRPYFWRSSFRFSVVADGQTVDLWIPHSSAASAQLLARRLREGFPTQFEEIVA
jgi:hypothetical protein